MTDAPPNPRLLSQVPFRALIEHASDILTLIDAGRRIRYTSLSTRRILGYDPDAMLDQDVALFVHPHERATIIERLESVQATPGAVSTAEYRVQHADGSWRWIEGTATNLLDAPEVQAVVLNSHDVTVHREAERVLEHRVSQRTSELAALYRADAALYRSLQVEDVLKALVDPDG